MKHLTHLQQELQTLQARGLQRRLRTVQGACAPHLQIDGRPILAFASNDYLGLAAHPALAAALHEGTDLYGVGAGASHLISGHSEAHALLEQDLAAFLAPHIPHARAIYFGSGYLANLATLTALVQAYPAGESTIFSADLNHASIIDATRLSRAKVEIYPHQDMSLLARLLASSDSKQKIVVTDSVFSMDGTLADLPQLLAMCEQHEAWLVVDDAHGFACLGANGRGALEHFQLHSPHLLYMGTLGKAAGVAGAFVAGEQNVIEWLTQRARSYIYTTASPPALAHALRASLRLIAGEEGHARRAHLKHLIAHWQQGLQLQTWRKLPSECAIQPLLIGANQATVDAAQRLYAQGLWVPAIRPPTVPVGTARLRVSLSAAHSLDDVQRLLDALQAAEWQEAA